MRVSKTYKQSEWLVEGPEEMASLKADQAREVEDLKRRHEDEVENLKLKHERETERQSKKDEAEAERESQQEDTLPDIEDSKYLQDAVDEGKLVAGTLQVLDVITKKLKKEMENRYKKDPKDGMAFINQIAKLVGMTASDKKQVKNRMFLKMNDDSVMKRFNVSEKDMTAISSWKKKLKQVKGLTKQQLQILSTMPTPVITSLINQVGMIVAGDIQEDKEEQDRDIKDREGTQPKKYYKGLDKKTKEKRDAHFKQGKTGPAPGDEDEDGKPVKTKKSVHTKKFAKMFGEKLGKNADAGDYIKDFRKSDAPQFKGKSDKKIQKMAIAAYLDKKDK
tara:strand:+ start:8730 stop:9731 length:1002 start_codon:yes stop_codon:yes gene_type:complete